MTNLKVIEKNDLRVLTSAQVAEMFGTDTKMLSNNFNSNKHRYEEGKHYFVLVGEVRKDFLFNNPEIQDSSKHAKFIYLWTEKGVFLHAKSLGTDQAWNAYSALVDDYFKKTEQLQRASIPSQPPQEIEDILILSLQNQKQMKLDIATQGDELKILKEENTRLKLIVDNSIYLDDHQCAKVQEAVKSRVGHLKRKGYDAHFQSIFSGLKVFFTVPKYDKILRKDFDEAIEFINGWYPKKAEE